MQKKFKLAKSKSTLLILCTIFALVPFIFCSCTTALATMAAYPEPTLIALLVLGSVLDELDDYAYPQSDARLIASEKEVSPLLNERICRVLEVTNKKYMQVDITGDGQWNCQDKAITFVTLWNTYYKEPSMKVIYNHDKTVPDGLNHVFVQTYDKGCHKYLQIEPAGRKDYYVMTKFWRERYKLKHNRVWHEELMARKKKYIYISDKDAAYLSAKM